MCKIQSKKKIDFNGKDAFTQRHKLVLTCEYIRFAIKEPRMNLISRFWIKHEAQLPFLKDPVHLFYSIAKEHFEHPIFWKQICSVLPSWFPACSMIKLKVKIFDFVESVCLAVTASLDLVSILRGALRTYEQDEVHSRCIAKKNGIHS